MTVQFWSKIPSVSLDGAAQSGTFLDCGDSSLVRLLNDSLLFQTAYSANATSFSLQSSIFSGASFSSISQWNHFAVSFSSQVLSIYLNGILQATKSGGYTILSAGPAQCTIGNSQSNQDPINAYMRHLLFTKSAMSSRSNIQSYIHHITLPTDLTVLAYYKFQKTFNYEQTYLHSPTISTDYSANNLAIQSSSEAEFVCYCTGTFPKFLQVRSDTSLTPSTLSTTITSTGFTLDFTVYFTQPDPSLSSDIQLFSVSNNFNLSLSNNLTSFRLDLFDPVQLTTNTVFLGIYQIRYNFWTDYTLIVLSNSITLQVDGTQVYKANYPSNLPSTSSSFSVIAPPSGFSYLLFNVNIKTQKGVLVFNQTYTQNLVSLLQVTSGNLKFGFSNDYCTMSQASQTNYWNGMTCADNRLVPYFGGATIQSSNLNGNLISARSTMTIEMWFKDMNSLLTSQILFQNSIDSASPSITIDLSAGTNKQIRAITCTASSDPVKVQLQNTQNTWGHFACVSDADNNFVKAIYYNVSSKAANTFTLGGAQFPSSDSSIPTSLGSSINGDKATRFQGFIKELRIWGIARTDYQIQTYRYQAINAGSANLLHYFRLDDQFDPYSIVGVASQTLMTEQSATPGISYLQDKDLVLCQQGFIFNGQCCGAFDLSAAAVRIVQIDYLNQIQVSLDPIALNNNFLYETLSASFSLTSIGNNYIYNDRGTQTDYYSFIRPLFAQSNVQSFSVSGDLIDPSSYSITVQAVITSDYQPGVSVTKSFTYVLKCPNIWVSIVPNKVSLAPQTVSLTSPVGFPLISMTYASTCYTLTNGQLTLQTLPSPSFAWGWNLTSPLFTNVFSVASNSMSISGKNKGTLSGNSLYSNITASASYKVGKVTTLVSTVIPLFFSSLQIVPGTPPTQTFNLIFGQDSSAINIDLSSYFSSNQNTNPIQYFIQCPPSLFSSSSEYTSLCQISNTGVFSLKGSQLTVIPALTPYYFNVYIVLKDTSIMMNYTLTVQVYKDGSSAVCPRVGLNSIYPFNQYTSTVLNLVSDPFLSCTGQFYTINSANWTAVDSISGVQYQNIFSYGTQTLYLNTGITLATSSSVLAGSTLNVSVTVSFSPAGSSSKQSSTFNTQVVLSQKALNPQIVAQNRYGASINLNNGVDFIESVLVLNAATSSDPDNSTAVFLYSWTCPDQLNLYYPCQTLAVGNQLQISAYQRAKSQFLFNTPYTFGLTIISKDNPYKAAQSQSITVTFNPPNLNDQKNNTDMNAICDTLSTSIGLGGTSMYNSSLQKVTFFDKFNYSTAYYTENYMQSVTTGCKVGTVQEQRILFYSFGTSLFGPTDVPLVLLSQDTSTPINSKGNVTAQIGQLFQNLDTLTGYQFVQTNIYFFTVRTSSTGLNVSLIVDTVYYVRVGAQLVPAFVSSSISVDSFDDLYIDASASYDPENLGLNYQYAWSCPNNMNACKSQSSSLLKVTPIERGLALSNSNGSSYVYNVSMHDGIRFSPPTSALVLITQKDSYSNCFSQSLNTNNYNSNFQNNQTIYIQYGQTQSVWVQIDPATNCPYASSSLASFKSTVANFWTSDAFFSNIIYLQGTSMLSLLKVGTIYPININQTFTMGVDPTPYILSNFVNVQVVAPDLVPIITGNLNVIMTDSGSTPILTLYSSSSYDPMGLSMTSQWVCPSYLSGSSCSNSQSLNTLSFTYQQLVALSQDINSVTNMSHQFTLILFSSDGVRVASRSYFVYFASQTELAWTNATSCGIQLIGDTGLQLKMSLQYQFQFNCTSFAVKTGNPSVQVLGSKTIKWQIDGLTKNQDYFYTSNQLYLKAYALTRLGVPNLNEMIVQATIQNADGSQSVLKKSFPVILPQIQLGSVSISPSASVGQAYTTRYSVSFSNFQSTQLTGLLFQVRAYSNLYQITNVIYPMKQFSPAVLNTLMNNFNVPFASSLVIDFFGMNFTYLGSYNLMQNMFSSNSIVLGSISQSDFESQLNAFTSLTSTNYTLSSSGRLQFEKDIYSIRQLSEMITYSIISSDPSLYPSYQNAIIDYLAAHFLTVIPLFVSSSDTQSRAIIERHTTYALNAAMTGNTLTSNRISSVLLILGIITADFNTMTSDGNEGEVLRQIFISQISNLASQISQLTGINTYGITLAVIKTNIMGTMFKGLVAGVPSTTIASTSCRVVASLNSNSQLSNPSLNFQNQINQNEGVFVSNQSQLAIQYGINSLEATFAIQSNTSSPVASTMYINAYDSNNNIKPVSFGSDFGIQMNFQVNDMNLFSNLSQTYPVCKYFDPTSKQWSTSGVQFLGYNSSSGVISCQTSHLSQYSVDSYTVPSPSDTTPTANTSNSSNSTNTTNCTSNCSVNGTTVKKQSYMMKNINTYIIICVVSIVYVTGTILITAKWTRTKMDYHPVDVKELKRDFSFCQVFGKSFLQYHSFFSAYVAPRRGNIYVTPPQYNQMIFNNVYFVLVALLVELLMEHRETRNWPKSKMVITAVIATFIFVNLKSLIYTINFFLYFRNYPIPKQSEEQKIDNQKSQPTEHAQLRGRDRSGEGPRDDDLDNEGGESDEEESKKHHGVSSTKPHQGSKPHGKKESPVSREASMLDLDLDDIDVEIESSSKNAFFNKQSKGVNDAGKGSALQQRDITREFSSPELLQQKGNGTNVKSLESEARYGNGMAVVDEDIERQEHSRGVGVQEKALEFDSDRRDLSQKKASEYKYEYENPLQNRPISVLPPSQSAQPEPSKPEEPKNLYDKPPPPRNKCSKYAGLVAKLAFLYFKIAITLIFIYKLPTITDVHHFVRSLFGIMFLYQFIYEPIALFLYSIVFCCTKANMCKTRLAGGLLFGNFHANVVYGLLYSLNNN